MESEEPKPENKPAGKMPPPRPPRSTAVGLAPEGDGQDNNRRATITKIAEGEGRFIRPSGGRRHYAHVKLTVEPNGRGKGNMVIYEVAASAIPTEYTASVIQGVNEALNYRVRDYPGLDGCRLVDVVVRVVDGSFHQTDSTEIGFTMAGIFAIWDAIKQATPIEID